MTRRATAAGAAGAGRGAAVGAGAAGAAARRTARFTMANPKIPTCLVKSPR